jgi:hypothetical protein
MENTNETSMNLAQGVEQGKSLLPEANPGQGLVIENKEIDPSIIPAKPEIKDDDYVYLPQGGQIAAVPADEIKEHEIQPGSRPDTYLTEYMKEFDGDLKDMAEQVKEKGYTPDWKEKQLQQGDTIAEERAEYAAKTEPETTSSDEATVVIDKTGMGVVTFTPEQQAKLERAKKIKVVEVETVDLKKIRTSRKKKDSVLTIIKRNSSAKETPIVLPASGYTGTMSGLSPHELMTLGQNTGNTSVDSTRKWSLIHSKMVESGLGNLSFDEFLKVTAAADVDVFIYGLLVATYPDDATVPLVCSNPKCGQQFDHKYSVKSLIRTDNFSTKLADNIRKIADSSHIKEEAQRTQREAVINRIEVVRLPDSGYILELFIQSAYDFLYSTIKGIDSLKEDTMKTQAALLSLTVKKAYIPDLESVDPEDPDYFDFDDRVEIAEIVYSLSTKDLKILADQNDKLLTDATFTFGLTNVHCPHCHKHDKFIETSIEELLFYQYQQEQNSTIE